MTKENDQHSPSHAAQDFVTIERDWFLTSTIATVVASGIELGVTLTIGGAFISGTLISGKTYFDELGKTLAAQSRSDGDVQSVLSEAWTRYTTLYEKPEGAGDDWKAPPVGFIHLRGARLYSPGQRPIPDKPGMLWRGKLSAVDGFTIGQFTVT